MRSVLFRANADLANGTGDLLSLIHLSDYFGGWNKYYITNNSPVAKKILKNHRIKNVIFIQSNTTPQEELQIINKFVKKRNIDVFFLEITNGTTCFYKDIETPIKACVDFYGKVPRNFDFVINWDENKTGLYKRLKQQKVSLLLGHKYVILPKNILKTMQKSAIARKGRKEVKNVMITLGGFDEFNFTLKIAMLMEKISNRIKINIILGAGYKFKKELLQFLRRSSFYGHQVQQNIKDMVKEYRKADLVITAGGLSLYEVIALRKPAAILALYPHQAKRSESFARKKHIVYLGFRKINKNKLIKALYGDRFKFCRSKFLINTIPGIMNEKLADKI